MKVRNSISRVVVAAALVAIALGAVPAINDRAASAQEAATCQTANEVFIAGEQMPDGVHREAIFYEAHAYPATATGQITAGSIVCIDAGTTIAWVDPSANLRTDLGHLGETMIAVISGELHVTFLAACIDVDAEDCSGGTAIATAANGTTTDLSTVTAGVTLKPGDVLRLKNVTVTMDTPAGSYARIVTFGYHGSIDQGGGCPAACWQFP